MNGLIRHTITDPPPNRPRTAVVYENFSWKSGCIATSNRAEAVLLACQRSGHTPFIKPTLRTHRARGSHKQWNTGYRDVRTSISSINYPLVVFRPHSRHEGSRHKMHRLICSRRNHCRDAAMLVREEDPTDPVIIHGAALASSDEEENAAFLLALDCARAYCPNI